MTGLLVYDSLSSALRDGYHIFDRTSEGYLVRIKTSRGWALALAKPSTLEQPYRV